MAKRPDRPAPPKYRDPAKHSKKDPAKPTRAKAARPDSAPLDPSLADLLNPGIGRGRAGVGSQTGLDEKKRASTPSPRGGDGRAGVRAAAHHASATAQSASEPERRLPTPTPGPSPQGGGEERAVGEEQRRAKQQAVGEQTGAAGDERAAYSVPSPLVGEGSEGGRAAGHHASATAQSPSEPERRLPTPTPGPSPQGGGEERAVGEEQRRAKQ